MRNKLDIKSKGGEVMTIIEKALANQGNEKLHQLIQDQKAKWFTNPDTANDTDVLGIMIAQYCKWQGDDIFDVSYNAFEDANYHSFNTNFKQLWENQ